jgi:hypothetical protein
MPKGRAWLVSTQPLIMLWLRRRFCRPEQCDSRTSSWLRGQRPTTVYLIVRSPLIVAVSAMTWTAVTALSRQTLPDLLVLLAFVMLFAKPVSRLWEQTEQTVEEVEVSPWMSAQRIIS